MEYGGSPALDPPAPEDEDNIMAAIQQFDRVSSISLTVTRSLLERLSTIEMRFFELEDLVLLSRYSVQLTQARAFRWGSRLRRLHLTGIAFPAFLRHLSSSRDLVDIQLHDISDHICFPPEAFAKALSGMTQLQSLSLHFIFSRRNYLGLPQPLGERIVLPALTCLKYRGTSRYLDRLVARIFASRLEHIEITFCNEFTFDFSNLSKFVDRIEMQKSHRQADILFTGRSVSMSLTQPASTYLKLQVFCRSISRQLFSIAGICSHLSAFLFCVEDLYFKATRLPSRQDGAELWPELIHSFRGTKRFHVAGAFATHIMLALRRETVLPGLHKLRIRVPEPYYTRLRGAVESLTVSRRLSGNFIGVEYERLWIDELAGKAPSNQHVMIEKLSDDVLLNIFRQYLDTTPRFWYTLAWVCKIWRHIVLASPLGLDLRLYCTYGTPVFKALDCWPVFPIIVQYGGYPNRDPPAPEDDDNIIAALKQSSRIRSISLTITSSLLEKFSTISEPFSELEELALMSRDYMRVTLPGTFRWGARLRTLQLTGIAFPSFPQLLSPSHDLLSLLFHEIPITGYFPPQALANALSGMTNLRTLSLHFISLPSRRNYIGLPLPPGERIVLPVLTCLKYRGTSKYLDCLVARIDAPCLRVIEITFFGQPTMDASQLGQFIERIDMLRPLRRADIKTSAHAIYISFTDTSTSTLLQVQISCKQLDWQLSSMAQLCDQFSSFLFRVRNLIIDTTQLPSGQQDDAESEHWQWPELIHTFGAVNDFRVVGVHVTDILCALRLADGGHTAVLPDLRSLHIEQPVVMHGPSWDALQSFVTSRWLSGHPVRVHAHEYTCHICHATFTESPQLKTHLVIKHAYRLVCSYCDNFEWSQRNNRLFQEHLKRDHPEVAQRLTQFDPFFTISLPLLLDSIVDRHVSPREPDIVVPSSQ